MGHDQVFELVGADDPGHALPYALSEEWQDWASLDREWAGERLAVLAS